MNENKIREYIMVKDKFNHAKLEEVRCYDYYGELQYTDDIYYMLNNSFKMDRLITETSYVIAFDHKKMPKGICKIGQGGLNETPTPMQPLFTFLLLSGASSFVVAHNHVSDMPDASASDKMVTKMMETMGGTFDMEFIGHMIINPNGYIINGGSMDGLIAELDEEGEIVSRNIKEAECEEKTTYETVDDMYEAVKELGKKIKGR